MPKRKINPISPSKAVKSVCDAGVLLVFPVKNAAEPASIWSSLMPKVKMKWEWTEDGDDRVLQMWQLMKQLSSCREVIYSKWYQGRATFFSPDLFEALIWTMHFGSHRPKPLSTDARLILEVLEVDSPQSTKQIKRQVELTGKDCEARFNRAMKELFQQFLIVGYGEVEDGAFPSLAVGCTKSLYEENWSNAKGLSENEVSRRLKKYLGSTKLFQRFFDRTLKSSAL
jgi:hypothetical protein